MSESHAKQPEPGWIVAPLVLACHRPVGDPSDGLLCELPC